ncbi:hypothetical protein [Okeania sp. KiyG1]|uniref:hypothetical protein n=1 Tax=Okeania sp. KiyG1 TaxID=2720165 RepID=UPI001F3190EF|nr:hypothetical protein [Okeania sp. KiyG1]
MWKSIPSEQIEENIFDVVNQLNIGRDLITETELKEGLLKLNLWAGKKAKGATAYEAAGRYLNLGLELLPTNSWESHYELTRELYVETLEVEYLNTNFERAQKLSEFIFARTTKLLEQVKVYELLIEFHTSQNQSKQALDTSLNVLEKFQLTFPKKISKLTIIKEYLSIKFSLSRYSVDNLANLPEMNDPYKLAAIKIAISAIPVAFGVNPNLFPLLIFKMVDLCLKHGNSPLSAYVFGSYSIILCSAIGDFETGYNFGVLSIELLNKYNAKEYKAKVYLMFNLFIKIWKKHLKETESELVESFQYGWLNGDIQYACECAITYCANILFRGKNLEETAKIQKDYLTIIISSQKKYYINVASAWNDCVQYLLSDSSERKLGILAKLDQNYADSFIQANNQAGILEISLIKLMIFIYLKILYKQ